MFEIFNILISDVRVKIFQDGCG